MRRILVNCHRDHLRKPWWRRERQGLDFVPEPAYEHQSDWESQSDVVQAVNALPMSMRHILALRYFADLSVRDTAQILGCSEGNVKSQTARGLAHLEQLLGSTITDGSVQS